MASLFDRISSAIQSPTARGLLGAAAVGVNPALGLLAVPALRATQQRQNQQKSAAELALERETMELQDAKSRRRAMQDIPRLLSSAPPAIMGLDGSASVPGQGTFNQRAMGLLSRAAPEVVAQGLFDQLTAQPDKPRVSTDIATMQALGIPITAEGYQQFKSMGGDDLDAILTRLNIEEKLRGGEQEAATQAENRELDTINTSTLLETGRDLIGNLDKLEGTFLEPGGIGMDARRGVASTVGEIGGLLGFDEFAEEQRQSVGALDKLKKDSADFVTTLANQLGANSATELRQIQDSFAGAGSSPAAIRAATRREMKRLLSRADARGIRIENRDEFESFVDSLTASDDVSVEFD